MILEGDVTLRHFTFGDPKDKGARKGNNFVGDVVWARDGKSFYLLKETGLLQRVNVETGQTEQFLDIARKCAGLAPSGEGLLVAVTEAHELWVVDPTKLDQVKRKIPVTGLTRVCCGVDATVAWVGTPKANRRGHQLNAVDLKTGKVLGSNSEYEVWVYNVSPDGKYLLFSSDDGLNRCRIDQDRLIYEELARIGGNNTRCICISNDSQYVAQPAGGGNRVLPDHPKLGYATFVYAMKDFKRPAAAYGAGGYPRATGIDPISGFLLGQNFGKPLILYRFATDGKVAEYDFKGVPGRDLFEFSIAPAGSEAIVRMDYSSIVHVRINKKEPLPEKSGK
jgi:hypothetical protein